MGAETTSSSEVAKGAGVPNIEAGQAGCFLSLQTGSFPSVHGVVTDLSAHAGVDLSAQAGLDPSSQKRGHPEENQVTHISD